VITGINEPAPTPTASVPTSVPSGVETPVNSLVNGGSQPAPSEPAVAKEPSAPSEPAAPVTHTGPAAEPVPAPAPAPAPDAIADAVLPVNAEPSRPAEPEQDIPPAPGRPGNGITPAEPGKPAVPLDEPSVGEKRKFAPPTAAPSLVPAGPGRTRRRLPRWAGRRARRAARVLPTSEHFLSFQTWPPRTRKWFSRPGAGRLAGPLKGPRSEHVQCGKVLGRGRYGENGFFCDFSCATLDFGCS